MKMLDHQNLLNHKVNLRKIIKLRLKMMKINNKKSIKRKIFYLAKSIKLQMKMMERELFILVYLHKSLIPKWEKNIVFNMDYYKEMMQFEFKNNLPRKSDYI
jgi:hypothetical protein